MQRRKPGFHWGSVELAAAFAVAGSVLAVVASAFVKNLHVARYAEAVNGLRAIGEGSAAYAEAHAGAFPASAPLTPATPPHGDEADSPELWQHTTWRALGFQPVPDGEAHHFAFGYDNLGTKFLGHAHQDRNHDGVSSSFEQGGLWTGVGVVLDAHVASERELE